MSLPLIMCLQTVKGIDSTDLHVTVNACTKSTYHEEALTGTQKLNGCCHLTLQRELDSPESDFGHLH